MGRPADRGDADDFGDRLRAERLAQFSDDKQRAGVVERLATEGDGQIVATVLALDSNAM